MCEGIIIEEYYKCTYIYTKKERYKYYKLEIIILLCYV